MPVFVATVCQAVAYEDVISRRDIGVHHCSYQRCPSSCLIWVASSLQVTKCLRRNALSKIEKRGGNLIGSNVREVQGQMLLGPGDYVGVHVCVCFPPFLFSVGAPFGFPEAESGQGRLMVVGRGGRQM